MLGFSCDGSGGSDVEEYGCPTADYIIKGTVTDEAGTPVQGIKTSLKQVDKTETETYIYGMDSLQTSVSGGYQLKFNGMENSNLKIIVEDVDGITNGGEFFSDTLDINYDQAVQIKKGDRRWYDGVFEVSQDIKLKKK
jgi:putative lipoprotein (rSAM/lipoprotein system)